MIKSLTTCTFGNRNKNLLWGKRSVANLVVFVVVYCSCIRLGDISCNILGKMLRGITARAVILQLKTVYETISGRMEFLTEFLQELYSCCHCILILSKYIMAFKYNSTLSFNFILSFLLCFSLPHSVNALYLI